MIRGVFKNLLVRTVTVLDILFSPFIALSALCLLCIRRAGIQRMRLSKWLFKRIGVYPLRDHYYEPLFNDDRLTASVDVVRHLPGLDWNASEQLALLEKFNYGGELQQFPEREDRNEPLDFFYQNPSFTYGDAEYLYSIIRHLKPANLIEIGSGFSTRMASAAIRKNRQERPDYCCRHVCIEPYEMPWLDGLGVEVLRRRVEEIPLDFFDRLQPSDILFIDSSHVIRPQGDVLYEFLELLPRLSSGVFVHVHDIFTPFDYPDEWLRDHVRLWNEQYLLEAFMSFNHEFRIIGGLSWLRHYHAEPLTRALPGLRKYSEARPGSFWIVRN